MGYDVDCVLDAQALLGECPVWDPRVERLYWADIDGRAVHRLDPVTGADDSKPVPGRPGSFALTETPGRLLVAMENALVWLDWDTGVVAHWRDLEPAGHNRLNDGRADPAGRFWVGSMFPDTTRRLSTGTLHRVDADGTATAMKTDIGVSNGLAFSPDGATMYFADTFLGTIWAYDYDPATGERRNERVFIEFTELAGFPDGGCVDADGCYWTACVYGWSVARITPEGRVDRVVPVPVQKPTMCAFGGPNLDVLYVTSIGEGGSGEPAPDQPLAGGLLAFQPKVGGVEEPRFAG